MEDEKTIEEGIEEAATRRGKHLREDTTPSTPGKPEAVNVERDEPITTAARRRDSFQKDEAPSASREEGMPDRHPRSYIHQNFGGRASGASETSNEGEGRDQQDRPSVSGARQSPSSFRKRPRDER